MKQIAYSEEISRNYRLPINIQYNNKRGYYFRINSNKIQPAQNVTESTDEDLNQLVRAIKKQSKEFLKITKISKYVHFTTKRILQLNERIKECATDIHTMSNRYFN